MFNWKRIALAVFGGIILLLLLTNTILPGIIINKAQDWVAAETERSLDINAVKINLFSLTAEVSGVTLTESNDEQSFVSWDLLRVSLSPMSLIHRAPIVRKLEIVNPYIHLVKLPGDQFNFSDLISEGKKTDTQPEESAEPVRFSVNNLTISKGSFDVFDRSLKNVTHHTIRDLELAIPFIGNLPFLVEEPVQPHLQAIVNDAPFELKGKLKPFAEAQELHVNLDLENIDLPHYLEYIPVELPVRLKSGRLNVDLDLMYRVTADEIPELSLDGMVTLTSLNIFDRLDEQVFFLPLLQCELAPANLLNNRAHIAALRVYNLEVQVKRDKGGVWNHSRLTMADAPETETETTTEDVDAKPFQLLIDELQLRDGVVYFTDNLPPGGFSTVARDITFDLRNLALDNPLAMPLSMSLKTDRDELATVDGLLALSPFTISLDTKLQDIQLAPYQPYYNSVVAVPLGGSLDLDANIAVTPDKPLLLSRGSLTLAGLEIPFNDQDGVRIAETTLTSFSFDLENNRFVSGGIKASDTAINVSRNKSGVMSYMAGNLPILTPQETLQQKPQEEAVNNKDAKPFSFLVSNFVLSRWNIDFKDNQPAATAHLEIKNLNLGIQNLALPGSVESPLQFDAELPSGGKVAMIGKLILAEQSAVLDTKLQHIPLKPIAPYLAEQTNLVLKNGKLNARLGTKVSATEELDLEFGGRIGINRMHLLDGTHKEDLLKWDSLQAAGIEGKLSPLTLAIDSVTLSDYFAKVLIDEDARLNLVDAFTKQTPESRTAEEQDVTEETADPAFPQDETSTALPDIRIDKVVLQGGQVDFTDRNLPRPFHADMTDLGGRVDGLSSHPGTQATVDLRGSLRNQSPLNISGQLNPLAEDIFLDVELSFRDIEMTPFSPYTGNYVGYLIKKGKLNLSLDYLIEDNQLKATNKVFLDQFDFGAPVESENATSLPVKLAVALLKDGNGEIHLDIPVYGSLEDPQFSIASVVWTVIKNLLVKAATSPFALLGAVLGGGGEEDFSAVSFDYGSVRLSTTEQDKLLRMSQALLDRPSLDVEISGFIDPEKDPEGYRKEILANKVKRLKYLDLTDDGELPKGLEERDVVVPPEEYADYLWDVYKDEDFPKPRNFIGMTKKLPESEMEKLIYANTDVDDNDLAELAQARALTVQNFLIESGQLPQERIFLKKPDITSAPEEETATRARAELGASVK